MGIYIAQGIDYIRRKEYEKSGFHIVIIDLIRSLPIIIICVYRSFRPTGISPIKFFDTQLGILKNALTSNCYILGDFNLDARMEGIDSYSYKPTFYSYRYSYECRVGSRRWADVGPTLGVREVLLSGAPLFSEFEKDKDNILRTFHS